jgi:hypothetical protein
MEYNVGYSMRGHNNMESYMEITSSSHQVPEDNSEIFFINEDNRFVFRGEHGILFHVVQEYEDFADTWACSNVYYEDNSHLEYVTFSVATEFVLK